MGTNLFVEGHPDLVVVKMKLPREVQNFYELKEITNALQDVDSYLKKSWVLLWPTYNYRSDRTSRLLWFRVGSAPEFEILTDAAWISAVILFLANYQKVKEGAYDLTEDINRVISGIEGLTERELELLKIAIRLTLERLSKQEKETHEKLMRRFNRVRQALIGRGKETPKIDVTKEHDWRG